MKVYFNNSCKICRSEINLYKKEKIEEIDWIDITNNQAAEKETNKNDKQLLRRLHVKTEDKTTARGRAGSCVKTQVKRGADHTVFYHARCAHTVKTQ